MKRLRAFQSFSAAAIALLLAHSAHAAIQVNTRVTTDNGVRAQAVITEASGFGAGISAIAIKEIHSAIFVIDEALNRGPDGGPGLLVSKRMLTAQEAYGAGLPLGYDNPPTTDPAGPWFGLVWPFRDQYDYFPDPFDPLADDVGTAFTIQPNVYGFIDVDGIVRGGPTDSVPAGGGLDRLQRGITGNGLDGPATYFAFDILALSGPADRFVTVQVLSTTARVVVRDNQTGLFDEVVVNVPAFETVIQLPEPGVAAGSIFGVAIAVLRRKRV